MPCPFSFFSVTENCVCLRVPPTVAIKHRERAEDFCSRLTWLRAGCRYHQTRKWGPAKHHPTGAWTQSPISGKEGACEKLKTNQLDLRSEGYRAAEVVHMRASLHMKQGRAES